MTDPTATTHFPLQAWHGEVTVRACEPIARDTFLLRFDCPELAQRIVPGQFLMVRLAGFNDPLLGRPLALYDTVLDQQGNPRGVDVVFVVIGKMTTKLAAVTPGQRLEVWGPLGNGFSLSGVEHLIMVAGGIGQTPFMALGRECLGLRQYGQPSRVVVPSRRVTLCYGVRSAEYAACVEDFSQLGLDVRLSTDDASAGHHGLVTDLLQQVLDTSNESCRIVCCGPEPMMAAVAEIAAQHQVPCQVSLETPMACGLGICFSCVARVRQADGQWDYQRTCVQGPVFEAEQILF
jgi:dihydroorotate dehydrogenase electron transfer subunit